MLNTRWMMCCPDYFGIEYVINSWMEGHIGQAKSSIARLQWEKLYEILAERAQVSLIEPVVGLPDLCFTANAGLIIKQWFIPAHFRHPERQREESIYKNWFVAQGFILKDLPHDIYFEGEGDALLQPEQSLLWLGYDKRTDIAAQAALTTLLDMEVIPLKLVNPYFYHLDTCFVPLSQGRVVYYPNAFDEISLNQIRTRIPPHKRLEVTAEDANQFACNAIILGDTFICNNTTSTLKEQLKNWGFEVVTTPLSEFLLAGGAAKCLALAVNA